MKLFVTGKSKKVSCEEYEYAVDWMMDLLVSSQMKRHLTINLILKKKKGLKGLTEFIDCEKKPREFKVIIDPTLSRKSQLSTLAHELVHVKQFAKLELRGWTIGSKQKWKEDFIDHDEVSYWDFPWEIEAYGKEIGMYIRYKDHLKQNNIKF